MALLHSTLESSIHAFNVRFPIPMDFGMTYGPLAYLHVLHIKDPFRKFQRSDFLHFIPSLLFDVLLFTGSFLYFGANMDWAYENIPLIQTYALFVSGIGMIQLAIYAWFLYQESLDTKQVLREFHQIKKWLSILIISWCLVIGFLLIAIPVGLQFINQLDENSTWIYTPLGIIKAIWIYGLGYLYLIRYGKVVGNYMDKVGRFKFAIDELETKKNELIYALEKQELYKDPKLTVAKLAGHLEWPINSVSKMINETLHTTFSDLISQYRVSAFKQLSQDPDSQKYSIQGLGQEVGFSSKASFYRVFKKETGMTPTEFMRSQL